MREEFTKLDRVHLLVLLVSIENPLYFMICILTLMFENSQGYSTGGGTGDTTPWVGWGADDVLEYEIILYDGTNLTANANENKDLFWALSGGGSGLGVITKIKTGVIQSPEPRPGQDRKFSYGTFRAYFDTDQKREDFWGAWQDFLYDELPEDNANAKFGGNFHNNATGTEAVLDFIFLGGVEEAVDILQDYHLLNYTFPSGMYGQVCNRNYTTCTNVDVPSQITRIYEFNTYGEAVLYKICKTEATFTGGMTNMSFHPDYGVCDALGLDQSKCPLGLSDFACDILGLNQSECPTQGLLPTPESCLDPEFIAKLAEAASNPLSFMNRPFTPESDIFEFTSLGGLLLPKLEASTLAELSKRTQFVASHLQHGAPTKRAKDYIAYPFREHAMLAELIAANVPDPELFVSTILKDPYYNNDKNKMSGYFNYMVRENVEMYLIVYIMYIAHFFFSEPSWQSQLA
jgi:hypothetical protein